MQLLLMRLLLRLLLMLPLMQLLLMRLLLRLLLMLRLLLFRLLLMLLLLLQRPMAACRLLGRRCWILWLIPTVCSTSTKDRSRLLTRMESPS